jgi:hypothetical protein
MGAETTSKIFDEDDLSLSQRKQTEPAREDRPFAPRWNRLCGITIEREELPSVQFNNS